MNISLVITTIAAPTRALQEFGKGSQREGVDLVVIGDSPSPPDFALPNCDYYSVDRQRETGLEYANLAPLRHYARKNVGYLVSMEKGCDLIVESDDDNYPLPSFWSERRSNQQVPVFEKAGWLNIYAYFSSAHIWPRGLPLDAVNQPVLPLATAPIHMVHCPIQQGLCNGDPDVDAIYRLVNALPIDFEEKNSVALGTNSWCPFNSQNTTWWPEAFPLLYLPGTCSLRMTDIWRSFVAQRIAWANGWHVLFHASTVYQERNAHNLMRDFKDEIEGYLYNRKIGEQLESLPLKSGTDHIPANLRLSYEELVRLTLVEERELKLLEAWLSDMAIIEARCGARVTKC